MYFSFYSYNSPDLAGSSSNLSAIEFKHHLTAIFKKNNILWIFLFKKLSNFNAPKLAQVKSGSNLILL
jgi:hypothetical protein